MTFSNTWFVTLTNSTYVWIGLSPCHIKVGGLFSHIHRNYFMWITLHPATSVRWEISCHVKSERTFIWNASDRRGRCAVHVCSNALQNKDCIFSFHYIFSQFPRFINVNYKISHTSLGIWNIDSLSECNCKCRNIHIKEPVLRIVSTTGIHIKAAWVHLKINDDRAA